MRRREFLASAGGAATAAAAASAASTTAAAQEQPSFPSYLDDATIGSFEDLRGNSSVTVTVGPEDNRFGFAPTKIWIDPGTTVTFEWATGGHNVLPNSQPSGSSWEGSGDSLESAGFTYEHTFETEGIYTYYCLPHEGSGMKGGIAVGEVGGGGSEGGGGGGGGGGGHSGGEELDPEEMGVPFRAHFVGIATLLGIFASLVFAFYILKYGESPHSSSPNRK